MSAYKLPEKVESLLATACRKLKGEGNTRLASILANAQATIREGFTYDSWDGGQYGHAIDLRIGESLYFQLQDEREELAEQACNELNRLNPVPEEFIAKVWISLALADEDDDWRSNSGLLIGRERVVSESAVNRVWGGSGYRVFLSHKSEEKVRVASIKRDLQRYGYRAFVAHEDIEPTEIWQNEIENALASADAFVALMSPDFKKSNWTDQEVGYAYGKGIPVLAVRLGCDPYGFIGRFQAIPCTWEDASRQIAKHLLRLAGGMEAYLRAVESCQSYENANQLAELLEHIPKCGDSSVQRLIQAYNENTDISGSFGWNGKYPSKYGYGILHFLRKWGAVDYQLSQSGNMIITKQL